MENENLVKPTDKAIVVLNAILCDALYKGTIKKGSSYPTEIHKRDLGVTFLNRMQVHYRVSRGNEAVVRKGVVKPVQIMSERRQGNKKVTKVSGLEAFLMDAELLASELQKKFACSTSVAELPGIIYQLCLLLDFFINIFYVCLWSSSFMMRTFYLFGSILRIPSTHKLDACILFDYCIAP